MLSKKNELKKSMLNHLKNDVYCRIGVSNTHGVGVIAISDIPINTRPFKSLNHKQNKIITLTIKDMEKAGINKNVINTVNDFFGSDGSCDIFQYGPNDINISYYLNHSTNNNLDLIETTDVYYEFITNRDIKKGEELFINYEQYE